MVHFLKHYVIEVCLVAIVTIILIVMAIAFDSPYGEFNYISNDLRLFLTKLMLMFLLSLPVFTTISMVVAHKKYRLLYKLAAYIITFAASALISITLSYNGERLILPSELTKYAITFSLALMSVFVVPSLFLKDKGESWNYLKNALGSFVVSNFYGSIAFAGLSIALLTINFLLRVAIDPRIYEVFGTLTLFTVNAVAFLVGLSKIKTDAKEVKLPKSWEVLAKFLLIPLQIIYSTILYIYLITILVSQELPSNQLVWLTLLFIAPGFLSLIILYPLRLAKRNYFSKLYYIFYGINLIPLLLVYFYSIGIRIIENGFTPDRALVVILGVLLVILVCYLPFIKFFRIDVFLTIFGLLTLGGFYFPLVNINTISYFDQNNRFIQSLQKDGIIVNGSFVSGKHEISDSEYLNLQSQFVFLGSNYSLDGLRPYFTSEQMRMFTTSGSVYSDFTNFVEQTKITIRNDVINDNGNSDTNRLTNWIFPAQERAKISITGYDELVNTYVYTNSYYDNSQGSVSASVITINYKGKSYTADMQSYLDSLTKKYATNTSSASVQVSAQDSKDYEFVINMAGPKIVLVPYYIYGRIVGQAGLVQLNSVNGVLLIKD